MSKEKHIEEMARDIPQRIVAYDRDPDGQYLYAEQRLEIARILCHAGYRKQSEREWIVTDVDSGSFGEYEPFIEFKCPECGVVHSFVCGEYDWQYGDPIPWVSCPCCGAKMKGGAE